MKSAPSAATCERVRVHCVKPCLNAKAHGTARAATKQCWVNCTAPRRCTCHMAKRCTCHTAKRCTCRMAKRACINQYPNEKTNDAEVRHGSVDQTTTQTRPRYRCVGVHHNQADTK